MIDFQGRLRQTGVRKSGKDQVKSSQMVTLDDLFNKINEGKLKDLNIVIKADVQGSAEAMKQVAAKAYKPTKSESISNSPALEPFQKPTLILPRFQTP